MIWLLVLQLVTWEVAQPASVLHQGWIQVCGDEETSLEHYAHGRFQWELHVRAPDEFAVYDRVVSGEHEHGREEPIALCPHTSCTVGNLLGDAYHVSDVQTWRGKRQWTVPSLHLWLSVTEVPTSRTLDASCHAFNIRIERKE